MRKNEFLTKTLLFGAFALATAACSNEELTEVNPNINSGDDAPKLSITVKAPAGEGVVVRSATRAEGEIQDATEKAIKTVKVYLFKHDGTASSEETNFKFHSTMSFDATGDDAKGIVKYTDNSDGTYTCTKAIPSDLMGAKIKVAIIANDEAAAADTTSSTTLYAFRTGVLASVTRSATVEDGTYFTADTLVGGAGESVNMKDGSATGFPMAYIPSDSYELTAMGKTITAQLVRNVARIDICNYATDLTITGVELTNVKEKSYLFSGSSDASNVPSGDLTKLLIKPMKEYADSLAREQKLPYNAAKDGETGDDRETLIKELNTHRAFYLYEQTAGTSNTDCPKVTISYSVKSDSETDAKTGSVDVYFEKTADDATNYVEVKRNHIYTIVLGDGGAVSQGTVKATFVVKDWIEGETIDSELDPSTEGQD